ncbi:S-layer homology domain-containing protein [Ornithinibacillus scapharcae]|uniref:S-layer homology domain-containing protein n=1 Tax=Ornithinibacillus scapharcae TaxID=1147159 RepID=UPI000225B9C5|nr:S-layer homology domain-containing protein [Ornithinibacillus scapharcae]
MRHLKFSLAAMAATLVIMLLPNHVTYADVEEQVATTCDFQSESNGNPGYSTINCLLTEMALAYDVPPEIVKAIAEEETGWKHYDETGEVIISDDNGIGIMQITNQSAYDEQQLQDDIVYNIRAGVEILDQMFDRTDLPVINSKDRDVLEHWYFAMMAYNGTKPVNSPIVQSTGKRNVGAYQEKVIQNIADLGFIQLEQLPFKVSDFSYDSNSDANIVFNTMDYHFVLPFTKTKHEFVNGDKVSVTTAVRLRERPTTTSNSHTLTKGEILTITGPFVYDENPSNKNQFVWYPVKRSDGTKGYVASSYLKTWFKDLPKNHYAVDHIYYLHDRGIINGVPGGNFGLSSKLNRWQVVLMVVRANNLSLENRPDIHFSDVPKRHKYYKEIAAAVDEGYFEGAADGKFNPDATFTRREMAVVLQRIYDFPQASSSHPFDDVRADAGSGWYEDAVANLYEAGITNGTGGAGGLKFEPLKTVSRDQFAVFMTRAMDESYRLK